MIQKLQELAAKKGKLWNKFNDSENEEFITEFLAYARSDFDTLESLVNQENLEDFGVSEIIFEILSSRSTQYNDFLIAQIQRLIDNALSGKIKAERLESLSYFWFDNMNQNDYENYEKAVNYIISSISKTDSEKLKKAIIEQLNEILLFVDDTETWRERIEQQLHNEKNEIKAFAQYELFQIEESQDSLKKIMNKDLFFGMLTFVMYAALFMYSIDLYKKTFVGIQEIVFLAIGSGILGMVYHMFKNKSRKKAFRYFFESIFEWGIPVVGISLFLNYYAHLGDEIRKEVEILKKIEYIEETKLAKIFVSHGDYEKLIWVEYPNEATFNASSKVLIETKKGALGKDILMETLPKP